ncbi:TRBP2 protein, partial [Vidua macroura]|nr:TRBP2 protein [Vidua macroura]
SLEQMVAASPGKTPISLLQEYGTRLGRTPGYDLLKAEGQAHQPNFTFRVTLGDISCTGGTPGPQGPPGDPHTRPGPPLWPCPLTVSVSPHVAMSPHVAVSPHGVPVPSWCPCPLTVSLSPHGVRVPSWCPCPLTVSVSPHGVRVPSRCPCPLMVSVSPHGVRVPSWCPCPLTVSVSPHGVRVPSRCPCPLMVSVSPHGSGTSKKLAKRNAAAKMLVRIHNVPMEPRDGSEAEGEEDQFNMVLGALGG